MDGPDYIAVIKGLVLSVEMTRDKARIPKSIYLNLGKASKGPGVPISRVRGDRERAVIQLYEDDFFSLLGLAKEASKGETGAVR